MNSKQRLALIVAALAVAVIAFVVLNPSNDDDGKSDSTTAVETAPAANAPDDQVTETTPTATTEKPAAPQVTRIAITGGKVDGGVKTIKVTKGDRVRIVITSDAPDQLHLHGYDVEKTSAPGQPARFNLVADAEGVFELESHTAEDQGLPPAVAQLVVEPS